MPMNDNTLLNIIGELPKIEGEELYPPLSFEEIEAVRTRDDFQSNIKVENKFLRDSFYLQKGIELKPDLINEIFRAILLAVDEIEDEHFKGVGLVGAGFLRSIDFGFVKKVYPEEVNEIFLDRYEKKLLIRLYFRFTTNTCPAGKRMMEKARKKVKENITKQFNLSSNSFAVSCIHGGTPWNRKDANDEYFYNYLETAYELFNL